ncbi:hypothetical protein KFK09_019484 [Dendrobium nobile]|uniref:Uncharacterized protein n=1 Tax=Dendrobium nobile TaxID=94219 RepID=A0A8T3ARD8_DENNO|nr:hypothetical protein KFK09_019484 [Dendrobium nobile]
MLLIFYQIVFFLVSYTNIYVAMVNIKIIQLVAAMEQLLGFTYCLCWHSFYFPTG